MIHNHIIHLQEVSSTNNYLKELSKEKELEEGTVILADYQTAGRGRGTNTWLADSGKSITMSVYIRPLLKAGHHFMLNEMLSVALVDVLASQGIYAMIKWPNDIYIADRKVAGLLIENVLHGDTISGSVLGIGLNVNQQKFPKELTNPVSMAQVLERSLVLPELTETILACITRRYEILKTGNMNQLHTEYSAHLYKRGEWISFDSKEQKVEGILFNVFQSGELCVRLNNGALQSYLYDEVQNLI
jgi:BirA family biotin operon repressor/biotin-[acetyl-CoA-carboxylase] ligase